jgi:hypothetical protein
MKYCSVFEKGVVANCKRKVKASVLISKKFCFFAVLTVLFSVQIGIGKAVLAAFPFFLPSAKTSIRFSPNQGFLPVPPASC